MTLLPDNELPNELATKVLQNTQDYLPLRSYASFSSVLVTQFINKPSSG